MTREDINDIINAICPNDEDYEKPCISPKYLRQELEQLALDQRQWNEQPTTKKDLGVDCIDRAELLKAMDTWDKFGYTETGAFVAMRGHYGDYPYTPYVHYNDMVSCVKNMASITPICTKLDMIKQILEDSDLDAERTLEIIKEVVEE